MSSRVVRGHHSSGPDAKESRRIKRRQDEAESWAQARLQNLTLESPPTNRVGATYLAHNYPELVDPPEDTDIIEERPLEYTIKEARRRRPEKHSESNKPERSIQQDAADVNIDTSDEIQIHRGRQIESASEPGNTATLLDKPPQPVKSDLSIQNTQLSAQSLHHQEISATQPDLEQIPQPVPLELTSRSSQHNRAKTPIIQVNSINLEDLSDLASSKTQVPYHSNQTVPAKCANTPIVSLPPPTAYFQFSQSQIRHRQATQLMQAYVKYMNSIDERVQISNLDCIRLAADTEILLTAFASVIGPQRYPKSTTNTGSIYRIIPPPGLGGPKRVSMESTNIWASRMILASDQPEGIIESNSSASQGVVYFDGIYKVGKGNPWGREPVRSTTVPGGPLRGWDAPGSFFALPNVSKPENGRPRDASKFHLASTRTAPPVHIAATTENRTYMSAPEESDTQKARAVLAMEVARLSLKASPMQLLNYMAIPVLAVKDEHATCGQQERRRIPDLRQNLGLAGQQGQKSITESKACYRIVPDALKMDGDAQDIDVLIREAKVPFFQFKGKQRDHGGAESRDTRNGGAESKSRINATDDFTDPITPLPKGCRLPRTIPFHRRTPAQVHINELFKPEVESSTRNGRKHLVARSFDGDDDSHTPPSYRNGFKCGMMDSGEITPVATKPVRNNMTPTTPAAMRNIEQQRPATNGYVQNNQTPLQMTTEMDHSMNEQQYESPMMQQHLDVPLQYQTPQFQSSSPISQGAYFDPQLGWLQIPTYPAQQNQYSPLLANGQFGQFGPYSPVAQNYGYSQNTLYHQISNSAMISGYGPYSNAGIYNQTHNGFQGGFNVGNQNGFNSGGYSTGYPHYNYVNFDEAYRSWVERQLATRGPLYNLQNPIPMQAMNSNAAQGSLADGIGSMTPPFHRQRIIQDRKKKRRGGGGGNSSNM